MQRKLTITIDQDVYQGLYTVVGKGNISRFIEDLVRPYVLQQYLDSAYQEMAQEEERKGDAFEWAEATIADVGDAV
jgi:hypothetical protein